MTTPQTLYQDDYLLVLEKPAGWVVNQAKTTRGQETVEEWLRENFSYPLIFLPNLRAGIAHRLDKDTSGVLLVAKDEKSLRTLQRQFKDRLVKKEYWALLHGKVPGEGTINMPVGRLPWRREEMPISIIKHHKINLSPVHSWKSEFSAKSSRKNMVLPSISFVHLPHLFLIRVNSRFLTI